MREIRKSNTEKIVISKRDFNGKERIDIRIYYYDVDNKEWRPTKKGITFQPELLDEFMDSLKECAMEKAI